MESTSGAIVTEEMISQWSEALDNDRWPEGWVNVGEAIDGMPPAARCGETMTVKSPAP